MEHSMEFVDYLVTHLGEGKFQVKMENNEIKEAGINLCGMIRYTYFEDYSLPEIGWKVTRKQFVHIVGGVRIWRRIHRHWLAGKWWSNYKVISINNI